VKHQKEKAESSRIPAPQRNLIGNYCHPVSTLYVPDTKLLASSTSLSALVVEWSSGVAYRIGIAYLEKRA
jgi:hypothetical protein